VAGGRGAGGGEVVGGPSGGLGMPGGLVMLVREGGSRCRERREMLINLAGRRLYYTLEGPQNGQVVCFTHSLASDGGMWAEQLPGPNSLGGPRDCSKK